MKSYRTAIFILCVLAGLAGMALVYPQEGIQIGSFLAEFPSLDKVMGNESEAEAEEIAEEEVVEEEPEPDLSPEELVAQRLEELKMERDSEFLVFCQKSPTRLYLPNDDMTFLDPVFDALENARNKAVRILHYGDSQLEGDRITGVLREHFQETFGGYGPGMLPAVQTIGSAAGRVSAVPELEHYMYFGSSEFFADHKRYGPLAQMAVVDTVATFYLQASGSPHSCSFRKVSVALAGDAECTLSTDDTEMEMTSSQDASFQGLRLFTALLPHNYRKATVRVEGSAEVYGILMDGMGGVSMDNIAMRGASGTIFSSIDRNTMAPFFRAQNVRLILLQFGGNSVPYLKGKDNISNYKKQLQHQIAYFQKLAPEARIIFIGPADMATNEEGEMKTYPQLPLVVDSLRQGALESGAAFWDMYKAMGGRGSMAKWVEADPPLAGEDYIHFTPLGAKHISKILYETIDLYYRYYRFRTGLDEVEMPDSTAL